MTKRRNFGRTGLQVSPLGYGAAPAAFLDAEQQKFTKLINQLLDDGINVIDTAASYPGSEQAIGQAVSHRRSDYVLISKCGSTIPESSAPAWSEQLILDTVDRALRFLRTDRLDVMLLHSCDLDTLKKGEAIGALVKAREQGKIAHAGYSGDNEAAAYAAGHADIAVIETSINIADQVNIDGVLPLARKNNVGIIAKRPIANAAWKDITQQQGLYRTYAQVYTDRLQAMKISPADLGFTDDPAITWPEIALRFTLGFPEVSTAIIGTTKLANAQRNAVVAEKPALSADAVRKLRDAFQKASSGSWTGQT